MFVIARHSSFRYKGKTVDVKQVGRELGVRYLLEGSVRKAENRVRINAQLVDAVNGNHLWSERYDREQKDLFKLQNEILNNIVTSLDVKLVEGEQAKLKLVNDFFNLVPYYTDQEHWGVEDYWATPFEKLTTW